MLITAGGVTRTRSKDKIQSTGLHYVKSTSGQKLDLFRRVVVRIAGTGEHVNQTRERPSEDGWESNSMVVRFSST